MIKRLSRGSIERRFVASILWVGVIPMALAMIIGYIAARETQQIATLQNLATAAGKTVDGICLALSERERAAEKLTQMPVLVSAFTNPEVPQNLTDALDWLTRESRASGNRMSQYALYTSDGQLIKAATENSDGVPTTLAPDDRIPKASFIDYHFDPISSKHMGVLATPIKAPDNDQILGYLTETQSIQDLLRFIFGDAKADVSGKGDRYELFVFTAEEQMVVYPGNESGVDMPPPLFATMDPKVVKHITNPSAQNAGAMFLWNYNSRGKSMPVLLAYQQLMPNSSLYISVHRPTPQIFSRINFAAVVALAVSALIIGVFCIIAYRIVNNSIIQPVSLLNEGAQIIRQGDLDLKLRINTGDEIEDLADSFNEMAAALRSNLRQLRESEEKYRNLVTAMRDGLFQADGEGAITFINPAGVAILGFRSIDEAARHKLRDLFVDQAEYDRIFTDSRPGQYIESARVWMRRPDATSICVELSGSRFVNGDRNITGIEGTFRDVTRSVRLEQEAAEKAERISVINQIANAVNTNLEAGRVYDSLTVELRKLIVFDFAAVSLCIDDAGEQFESRQLWPEPREGREQFPRLDGSSSCAAWVAAEKRFLLLENLRAANSVFGYQFPDRIHSVLCIPLYAAGQIIGTLNLGADQVGRFTEHDVEVMQQLSTHLAAALRNAQLLENLKQSLEEVTRAREKLHAVNEELKSLDEMKTNLLSNVSHELRTPLVAVMGYTDMVINGKAGPVTDTQREYLGISLRNVEKLVTLIENLLDFSRLHRGTEELVFTRFDLLDCIRISCESVKPVADGRNISLNVIAQDDEGHPIEPPVFIDGDKGQLGQVFNNLLSNAVKFNMSGGSITVEVEVRNRTAYIAVTDTGIGIPEDALDKVFSRFYQVDSSSTRKYGGTGIGLAIAQDIVRLHGSRLTVSSKLGQGATFRFSLHISRSDRDNYDDGQRLITPLETHLIVELVTQDRALATQIRNLLLADNIDIIHAAYPAAAVSLAERHNPDCMLIDTEAGPLASMVIDEIIGELGAVTAPVILITNDDALYDRYQHRLAGRIRRSFRKSTLLSGIHYALSGGLLQGDQLGDKILCVDDDMEIVQFIQRCLENEGFEADFCISGEDALERADSGEYWMILLDAAMPGIDGWKTCRQLKSNPQLAGIRVYIVTAKPIDANTEELRESSADGYLLKPFKGEDLLSVVRAFNTQRRNT